MTKLLTHAECDVGCIPNTQSPFHSYAVAIIEVRKVAMQSVIVCSLAFIFGGYLRRVCDLCVDFV